MSRITWQNVAAPDFSDALQGQSLAAQLFGQAAKTISGALDSRDATLRAADSNEAMSRALQIQDPNEWNKMMASQGLAGLGINPRRATEALMNMAQTRGMVLDKAADADYSRERRRLMDGRSDAAYAGEQAANQRLQEAMATAYGLVPGSTTKEEARLEFMRKAQAEGYDPLKVQAGLSEIERLDDGFWRPTEKSLGQAAGLEPVLGIQESLTGFEDQLNQRYGANTLQRLYGASVQKYDGVPNIAADLASEIRSKKDSATSEEDKELYETSAGRVAANYNKLMDEFNVSSASGISLPPEVIGLVLQTSIKDNGWVFTGDKMKLAMDRARKTLGELSSPENQKMLAGNKLQIERDYRSVAGARKSLEEAQRQYALGLDRGDEELVKRSLGKIWEVGDVLRSNMGVASGEGGVSDPRTANLSPMSFLGPVNMGTTVPETPEEAAIRRAADQAERERIRAEPRNRGNVEAQDQRAVIIQEIQQKLQEPGLNPMTRAILQERLNDLVAGQETLEGMLRR